MPSLLEIYLDQVAVHLTPLPVKRRDEELREIRQHLLNAVTVNKELGQSAEDAAANAVMQFGKPEDLGDNLVWAWQREKKLNRRNLWGAAACTFGVLFFMPLLPTFVPFAPWFPTISGFNCPVVAGALCGGFFAKRGLAGSALGIALYYYGFGACLAAYSVSLPEIRQLIEPLPHALWLLFVQQTEASFSTLFFAWVVNRWRLRLRNTKCSRQAVRL